jgi:hypothetical protein
MGQGPRDIVVRGVLPEKSDGTVRYVAAAPSEYMSNFSGSGLPFASAEQAFHNTPNRGRVRTAEDGRTFEIRLYLPNTYMRVGEWSTPVKPTLYIQYGTPSGDSKAYSIRVSDGIPYRSLTYPRSRTDVSFYSSQFHLPIRSQERILREAGFPSTNAATPRDHFGSKPPM